MRNPRALAALIAPVIAASTLAACSSGNDTTQATKGNRTVTVTMTDNAFAPEDISAKAGETVTFEFVNDGQTVHEAYIGTEEDQEDHAAEMMGDDSSHSMDTGGGDGHSMGMGGDDVVTVKPGEDAVVTKELTEAGTMVIGCHQPGHWESGMKATVTVG
jgi:uncharacterized cupredoxin-like copper-binding protein